MPKKKLIIDDAQYDHIVGLLYECDGVRNIIRIADVHGTSKESYAIAERICQCVNNVDALLKACEAALDLIETARQYFPKSIKNSDKFKLENTCAAIGTAIAQAKGEI